jgi:uncharacterized membrane protein
MAVLAVAGLALASYLTYVHYAGIKIACVQGHDECAAVQSSVYSKLAGVPVALMGALGYAAILISLLLPEREATRLATLVLTLGGFGFSAYLTYREVFSLEKICEWCVGSAILMTVLTGLAMWRFLRGDEAAAGPAVHSSQGSQPQLGGA